MLLLLLLFIFNIDFYFSKMYKFLTAWYVFLTTWLVAIFFNENKNYVFHLFYLFFYCLHCLDDLEKKGFLENLKFFSTWKLEYINICKWIKNEHAWNCRLGHDMWTMLMYCKHGEFIKVAGATLYIPSWHEEEIPHYSLGNSNAINKMLIFILLKYHFLFLPSFHKFYQFFFFFFFLLIIIFSYYFFFIERRIFIY